MVKMVLSLCLLSIAFTGCAHKPDGDENKFVKAEEALDPAVESNWPSNWASDGSANAVFASFVRHAEGDRNWLILGLKGEAVYVRPADSSRMRAVFQQKSNKVESLNVPGEAEVLSLRQYARCKNLEFNAKAGTMKMSDANVRRNSGWR